MALPGDRLVVHEARASPSRWPSRCTGRGGGSIADGTRSRCANACSRPPRPCSGLAGLSWVGIAWAGTGDLQAYTDTELAWRSAYIGYRELVPFTAWFQSGDWWLGQPLGTIAVIAIIAGFALAPASPAVGRLGVDIRIWSISYALYLLAVFFPQSSTFRILAPLFPLLGASAPAAGLLVPVGPRRAVPRAPGRMASSAGASTAATGLHPDERWNRAPWMPLRARFRRWSVVHRRTAISQRRSAWQIMEVSHERGSSMAAMKPRTGDGPMEAVKEGRLIIVCGFRSKAVAASSSR